MNLAKKEWKIIIDEYMDSMADHHIRNFQLNPWDYKWAWWDMPIYFRGGTALILDNELLWERLKTRLIREIKKRGKYIS